MLGRLGSALRAAAPRGVAAAVSAAGAYGLYDQSVLAEPRRNSLERKESTLVHDLPNNTFGVTTRLVMSGDCGGTNTRLQVFLGLAISIAFLLLVLKHEPYKDSLCGRVQVVCQVQVVYTYATAVSLFFDDGSGNVSWGIASELRRADYK